MNFESPHSRPRLQAAHNSAILYGMKSAFRLIIILSFACAFRVAHVQGNSLRILTINVWSGLDYKGFFKMGEHESDGERAARFRPLVTRVKELSPDVVFVQEANPVARYASDLASALFMEEIHQVVNGGIKVGPLGVPTNLKEGLVILARPELSLKKMAAWKLSGPPGLHSDMISFHLSEVVLALEGKITVEGQVLYLVNVHLAAAPRVPEDVASFRQSFQGRSGMDEAVFNRALGKWREREKPRSSEIKKSLPA